MGWEDAAEEDLKSSPKKSSSKSWEDLVNDDDIKEARAVVKKEVPWYQVENPSGRSALKGFLGGLPAAGMVAGGLASLPSAAVSGPMGPVAGAGAGGLLGTAAKQAGESIFLGEEPLTGEKIQELGMSPVESMASEAGGQAIAKPAGILLGKAADSKLGKSVISGSKKVAGKIGELFTGIPEQDIKTYIDKADEIKSMAKASDSDTFAAAEEMRSQFGKSIDQTRSGLNNQISSALKSSNKVAPIQPIIDSIESAKGSINPKLYPEQIGQIDDLVLKIKSLAKDGNVSTSEMHEIKQFLQDKASSSYRNPGQPFSLGTEASRAAKQGASKARGVVNSLEPQVAEANNTLAKFHDIEDSMNMNLISEGKPEAALLSAGSGGNPRNVNSLKELGLLTGTDMLGEAQKLSAMRSFGNPKLLAADSTGKAAGRGMLASGIGYLAGGPVGAVTAPVLTSPMALKTGIDLARGAGKAAEPAGNAFLRGLIMNSMRKEKLSPEK